MSSRYDVVDDWWAVLSKEARCVVFRVFVVKQKTAYEVRISDWSSDVCSSDHEFTKHLTGGVGYLAGLARYLVAMMVLGFFSSTIVYLVLMLWEDRKSVV